jgi:glutamine amidotransferase
VTPRVAVLDYGIGNLRSAQKTLERVGADPILTADPDEVAAAAGVVLPGVGAFGRVMEAIRETGVDDIARSAVDAGTPFIGICVGMQALYEGSEESPGVPGLGVLPGTIRRLGSTTERIKVPQMQWNRLDLHGESALFADLPDDPWVYFVHGYAPEATDDVIATCEYGGTVTAAAQRNNVMATQFHPEKSGRVGVQIISNFVDLCREQQPGGLQEGRGADPAWSERPERSGKQ